MTKIPGLSAWQNDGNGFACVRLHYTADPARRDPAWAAENRKHYSPEQWRREQEIDFTAGHGIPAFGTLFSEDEVVRGDYSPPPGQKIYRGWDWGFQHPALVSGHFDAKGRMVIFLEYMPSQIQARTFIQRAKAIGKAKCAYEDGDGKQVEPPYEDWADWSGGHRTDKSPRTTFDIAREEGVFCKTKKMLKRVGFDLINDLLKSKKLLVHEECNLLLRGLRGEYALDEKTDMPESDGYFEHPFDALRYLLLGANIRTRKPHRSNQPKLQRQPLISKITGY